MVFQVIPDVILSILQAALVSLKIMPAARKR